MFFFFHFRKETWNIFPTDILKFGELEEFSLKYMEMLKVASAWACRERQPLWHGCDHHETTRTRALGLLQICSSNAAIGIGAN